MNRRTFPALLVAAALLLLPFTAFAAESAAKKQEEKTLQGEVLDLACYLAHNAKGPDHAMCAKKCAKNGQPMGLLTADGTVYILTASHKDATAFNDTKNYAGQKVEIRGTVGVNGSLKGLTVLAVKSL